MTDDQRSTAPLPTVFRERVAVDEHTPPISLPVTSLRRRRADTLVTEDSAPSAQDPAARLPCLIVMRGQLPGRLYLLPTGVTAIGRAVHNDIALTDSGVSREHARVDVVGNSVRLTDVDSSNGTFVGGDHVQNILLEDRAKFSLGERVTMRLDWLDADDRAFQHAQFESLTRDRLTHCHNRAYLDEEFLRAVSVAHRTGGPLCAMVLDLDHFKRVNDQWGHAMGDTVLRTVADTLQKAVREEDVLARVGGEEFVLLMPNTALATAAKVAERIRQTVGQTSHTVPNQQDISVTVSIGVASLAEVNSLDAEALTSLADVRLYRAKSNGRDQVVITGGEPSRVSTWRAGTDRSSRSVVARTDARATSRRSSQLVST